MMTKISMNDLCTAMVKLQPDDAASIVDCAKSSAGDPKKFCRAVQAEIGGTLLFDAMMALRGGSSESRQHKPEGAVALFEHACECRAPSCGRTDCLELRGMLSALKAHAQQCKEEGCMTCRQWQRTRDAMRRARARPTSAAKTTPVKSRAAAAQLPASHDEASSPAGAALMMLARSALGDLPPSRTPLSPANSPPASPMRKRTKPSPPPPSAMSFLGQACASAAPLPLPVHSE